MHDTNKGEIWLNPNNAAVTDVFFVSVTPWWGSRTYLCRILDIFSCSGNCCRCHRSRRTWTACSFQVLYPSGISWSCADMAPSLAVERKLRRGWLKIRYQVALPFWIRKINDTNNSNKERPYKDRRRLATVVLVNPDIWFMHSYKNITSQPKPITSPCSLWILKTNIHVFQNFILFRVDECREAIVHRTRCGDGVLKERKQKKRTTAGVALPGRALSSGTKERNKEEGKSQREEPVEAGKEREKMKD